MNISIHGLIRAITQNAANDAFAPHYIPAQWEVFGSYLQLMELGQGQVLIEQGAQERTLFFIESGALSVHVIGSTGQMQLAILNAGAVVGEGAFFSHQPRAADVITTAASRLWRLSATRFAEMVGRHPEVALELSLALGMVITRRMAYRPKRIAVT